MRRIEVRREELYELVWSKPRDATKPRTTIAKELGISDVRVGKLCRDMNISDPYPNTHIINSSLDRWELLPLNPGLDGFGTCGSTARPAATWPAR